MSQLTALKNEGIFFPQRVPFLMKFTDKSILPPEEKSRRMSRSSKPSRHSLHRRLVPLTRWHFSGPCSEEAAIWRRTRKRDVESWGKVWWFCLRSPLVSRTVVNSYSWVNFFDSVEGLTTFSTRTQSELDQVSCASTRYLHFFWGLSTNGVREKMWKFWSWLFQI